MRLLIVLGAGASYDSWPEGINAKARLPLAVDLFKFADPQKKFLESYRLMSLADTLHRRAEGNDSFDLEGELEEISTVAEKRHDDNVQLELFKVRFYLQNLIWDLVSDTLTTSNGLTVYVRFLSLLKEWIDENPDERQIDIISFNYDNLLEEAMSQVYPSEWSEKKLKNIENYYAGKSLRIYKPHGSINWGRAVVIPGNSYVHGNEFDDLIKGTTLTNTFNIVLPHIYGGGAGHNHSVPAIAVPFKTKNTFDECPEDMIFRMREAISASTHLLTIGWKGGDAHVVDMIYANKKLSTMTVVSPEGDSLLSLSKSRYPLGFRDWIYGLNINKHLSLKHFLAAV